MVLAFFNFMLDAAANVPRLNAEVIANSYPDVALNSNDADIYSLMINGGLSPLNGYMDKKNFISSMKHKQLQNGVVWPIPLSLPITPKVAKQAEKTGNISIRDKEGRLLGVLRVSDIFSMQSDKIEEKLNDGRTSKRRSQEILYAGGEIEAVQDVTYYTHLDKRGIRNVILNN